MAKRKGTRVRKTRLLAYRLKLPQPHMINGLVVLLPDTEVPPSEDLWEPCPWLDRPTKTAPQAQKE